MASGRFVSASIADDTRLSRLSLTAELLYLKTIPHLDRDGMIIGRAGALWGKVCPLRDELMGEMQRVISEWVQVGLVIRMDTGDGPVLFFPGFLKNNTLLHYDRERPSRFPVPPGYERTANGLIVEGAEPKKKSKEVKVPPSSNGNSASVQDEVLEPILDEVLDFALQDQDQVKDQEKEESSPIPPLPPEPEAPPAQDEIGAVFTAWLENMPGTMTPILKDEILELIDECSARSVIHGITVSVEQNKRFFKYVASVARNHSAGREPPARMVVMPKLSEAERSALATRGKLARSSLQTAQKFDGYIDPQWQKDIDTAKGFGLL